MNPEYVSIVQGDLLNQPVEVIVNAWNRNIIPWWLLIPQGVSGAIKRKAGYQPFRELSRKGAIPLGGAVITSAGRLNHKAIIHVAGINMWWRSSEQAIRHSVKNALVLAQQQGLQSIAFPLIGAGTGGFSEVEALALMRDEVLKSDYSGNVVIVQFRPSGS